MVQTALECSTGNKCTLALNTHPSAILINGEPLIKNQTGYINSEERFFIESSNNTLSYISSNEPFCHIQIFSDPNKKDSRLIIDKIVKELTDPSKKVLVLSKATIESGNLSYIDDALEIAKTITDHEAKFDAYTSICTSLANMKQYKRINTITKTLKDNTLITVIKIFVAEALMKSGKLISAMNYAKQINPTDDQTMLYHFYHSLSYAFSESGQFDRAFEMLSYIEDADKFYAINNIVTAMANAGKFDLALESANKILDDKIKSDALVTIASAMAKTGKFDEATQIAITLKNSNDYSTALANISTSLANAGRFAEAMQVLYNIPNRSYKFDTLIILAILQKTRQYDEHSQKFLKNLLNDSFFRFDFNSATEIVLANENYNHLLGQAEGIAESISETPSRARMLIKLAIIKDGDTYLFDRAFELIKSIDNSVEKQTLMLKLFNTFIKLEKFTLAKKVAPFLYANTFSKLTVLLKGKRISEAIQVANKMPDHVKHNSLRFIAIEIAKSGDFKKAEEIADQIVAFAYKAPALSAIAEMDEHNKRLFNKALESANNISNRFSKAIALNNIALQMKNDITIFNQAREIAKRIDYPQSRADALKRIAQNMIDCNFSKESLDTAKDIIDIGFKQATLIYISSRLFNVAEINDANCPSYIF